MAEIEFEIDGKTLKAQPGQTIMQVADDAGIYIPRFCYHKHLTIAANCRMCLVEVEKSPKALPACATPIIPGMKVFTQSEKTIDAQRAVMEFLLINHPLDCPICDQGGECELQDLSMGYGSSHSSYDECKRSVVDPDLGPLIATDMTRCIYCTRCVRFGAEIAGVREMGGTYRGEDTEIGTYVKHTITSEVSGNIIDLCPVGALTSKPYRFRARAWELDQYPGVSPHDCLGSNLNIHVRYNKVMRVVSRENDALNLTWLSDRDRFSYAGLYTRDRLEEPLMRIDGQLQNIDWETALSVTANGLRDLIAEFGSDKLGALANPSSTLEEFYLLQKIIRALGSPHIDHRLRQCDSKDQDVYKTYPGFQFSMKEIEESEVIVLIGSNIQKEVPLIATRIRTASLKGATVIAINPVNYDFNFVCQIRKTVSPHELPEYLDNLVANVRADGNDKALQDVVSAFSSKQKINIILGALALHDDAAADIRYFAAQLAEVVGGKLGIITDGANSQGAWLAGAVPHRHSGCAPANLHGLNAYEMFDKARKAYLLLNVEPELDCANGAHAIAALKGAKFIVALSAFRNPVIESYANIVLPVSAFTETSGTYVNCFGEWQSFQGTVKPFRESRPAWKVLRVLGNFLDLPGFDYESSENVRHELHESTKQLPHTPIWNFEKYQADLKERKSHGSFLSRIGEIPIYAIDPLTRRSQPLQQIQPVMEGDIKVIRLHPETANALNISEGATVKVKQHGAAIEVPVVFDVRIAKGAAWIPGGIAATSLLGNLFGEVEVTTIRL